MPRSGSTPRVRCGVVIPHILLALSWRLFLPPKCAGRTIFQGDAKLPKTFPNLIANGEIFRLAGFRAEIDKKLDQIAECDLVCAPLFRLQVNEQLLDALDYLLVVVITFRLFLGFIEHAEKLRQLLEVEHTALEGTHSLHRSFARLKLADIREPIQSREQFVQHADRTARVEVIIHVLKELAPQANELRNERCAGIAW